MKTNPPPLYINIVNNIPSQIAAWHETGEEMRATAGGAVRAGETEGKGAVLNLG